MRLARRSRSHRRASATTEHSHRTSYGHWRRRGIFCDGARPGRTPDRVHFWPAIEGIIVNAILAFGPHRAADLFACGFARVQNRDRTVNFAMRPRNNVSGYNFADFATRGCAGLTALLTAPTSPRTIAVT